MNATPHDSAYARFSSAFPALLLAQLVLVAAAVTNGMAGASWDASQRWAIAGVAVLQALGVLLRAVPVLLLLSLPLLAIRQPRLRLMALALLWSLFIVVQSLLDQYYQVAHVPLGADLFGYSAAEIRTTLADGAALKPRTLLMLSAPLLALWLGLWWWASRAAPGRRWRTTVLLVAGLLLWLAPLSAGAGTLKDDAARELASNKLAWFGADVRRWSSRGKLPSAPADASSNSVAATEAALDPKYPFLRDEHTPDVLGPHFRPTSDGQPPNVVVIVVEGLGRSFSGPQASLGSFTPFLDELATRSLYFDNFLANQGRTFGVLPTLFGSAPFADEGFTALDEQMPAHPGLFSVLGQQGYHSAFYNGTDTTFDNERGYVELQQVRTLVDMHNFGDGYQRNPFSAWGYPDKELVSRVLADSGTLQTPFVLAVQTISMHTSYQFPDQERYKALFEHRLAELRISPAQLPAYRANADIYSTILYTDAQLRRYFDAVKTTPWYANTVFVVTGDHRLPEIPMGEHVERYHVPLLIFSPLLKQPKRVAAVSSQLDVTPSLLALLSNTYGLKRPQKTAWLGTGLDMAESFRNVHQLPLKQTKTSAMEYLADRWWLRDGKLYELQDGMHLVPAADAAARDWVVGRLQRYQQANAGFMEQQALTPEGVAPTLVAYQAPPPAPVVAAAPVARGLSMESAQLEAGTGNVQLTAVFSNGDARTSRVFVPLAVMAGQDGRELLEVYGTAVQLPAHGRQQVRLQLKPAQPADCGGRCYVSVFPSDPDTGKAVGQGRYRLPLDVAPAAGSQP
ncbi:LTA synthase family protein [Stenotrophomonas sp. SY1]|uniref:LTA synthase family protein n=1 Tax=Stenotrophomonas sp. SY1 TaxID=477235 RepID=UPI001E5BF10D|nr:LTA synthase family protein [Stenotrophomonas sp. SY1]MCD9085514.1 LTA synthase family protein [Stenotrophomonas sp. SY1]